MNYQATHRHLLVIRRSNLTENLIQIYRYPNISFHLDFLFEFACSINYKRNDGKNKMSTRVGNWIIKVQIIHLSSKFKYTKLLHLLQLEHSPFGFSKSDIILNHQLHWVLAMYKILTLSHIEPNILSKIIFKEVVIRILLIIAKLTSYISLPSSTV